MEKTITTLPGGKGHKQEKTINVRSHINTRITAEVHFLRFGSLIVVLFELFVCFNFSKIKVGECGAKAHTLLEGHFGFIC